MKTLPLIAFLAALAAFLFAPVSLEISCSLLFAAGFLGILISDYHRPVRPPATGRTLVSFAPAAPRAPALGLAA